MKEPIEYPLEMDKEGDLKCTECGKIKHYIPFLQGSTLGNSKKRTFIFICEECTKKGVIKE